MLAYNDRAMNTITPEHRKRIAELCRTYRVERLDLFGSATQGTFDAQHSDFDFIVRFADPDKPGVARRYFELAAELERLLGRPVDILTDRPIRNPFFAQSVAESQETIYESDQLVIANQRNSASREALFASATQSHDSLCFLSQGA